MDIKVGDTFLCIRDFVSINDSSTILFSRGEYYNVGKIEKDDTSGDNLYYLKGNDDRYYWYILDRSSRYYIYNYFDNKKFVRLKKLNKLNNIKL